MKISKLFHWLYGLVMLLPIFAIGVTCGYAMFNKNAYQSFVDLQNNNYYLENTNEIEENNLYTFQTINEDLRQMSLDYVYVTDLYFTDNSSYTNLPENINSFRIYYNPNGNTYSLQIVGDSTQYYLIAQSNNPSVITTYREFSFKSTTNQNVNYINSISHIIFGEQNALSNVFYYSVDKVTESPLFSWAYDSFLVAPFSYIVNLFGMPTNSVIVELLSYWLSISIIWLVFDLVMYVPLLVHRWIDKGVLE